MAKRAAATEPPDEKPRASDAASEAVAAERPAPDEPAPSSSTEVTPESGAAMATGMFRATMLIALVTILFRAFNRFEMPTLWDDAFIFQRYAHNLLAGDGLAWNPGGEPTYGLTSPSFVLPSALLQRATGGNWALGAMLASWLCGVAFVAGSLWLLSRHVGGHAAPRAAGVVVFLLCVASSATPDHFASGMDTTFALAYLALYLMAAARFEVRPSRARGVVVGLMGAVMFWVRPEMVALMLGIGVMTVLLWRDEQRRLAFVALASSAVALAVILLVNRAYFRSVLPLPFYAKSTDLYQGSMQHAYRGVGGQHFVTFVGHYWPMVLIVVIELTARYRKFWTLSTPLDKGAILALLGCVLYTWQLTIPIMAMSERMYQPLVVPLAFVTARTLVRWYAELAPSLYRLPAVVRELCACAVMGVAWILLIPIFAEQGRGFASNAARRENKFDVVAHAATPAMGPRLYWFAIDELAKLPDDLIMATTEVGFLGAMNPHKTIIDMAGLNERAFAHGPFDPAVLLGERRPDLIYMPHEDYEAMVDALTESPLFAGYEHFDKTRTRTNKFGIAIRKDSPHYQAMHRVTQRAGMVPLRGARPAPLAAPE